MLGVINCQGSTFLVKILFHVQIEVLKDQVNLILAMDDVHKVHDTRMVQFLKERHLTDGCAGNAFIRVLYFDFLQSDHL